MAGTSPTSAGITPLMHVNGNGPEVPLRGTPIEGTGETGQSGPDYLLSPPDAALHNTGRIIR